MNIGIVCYPTFGGSGVVATELGMALAARGHKIHFITYSQPVKLDRFSGNLFYHEVSLRDYPLFDYAPYELALTSKMVDVARHASLDLLHVHYAIPHASAAYMAKQILASQGRRLPFVTTLHGTDITLLGRDKSYEPVITFAINQSDKVTAVSKYLKENTCEHFDVRREISVIPNFVCMDEYRKGAGEELRKRFAPGGERVLMHTSNFRPVKRVHDVVRVFRKVLEKMPAKLVLIGDGPDRASVENLCRELPPVCDHLIMAGKLRDVEQVLMAGDLFLLTSEYESFGLSALEAMAAGMPVISTNTGGIPEVNIHGRSGMLSNVGDVEGMAANALSILGDDAALGRFSENARQRAAEFDIGRVLPMYEEVYEQALAGSSAVGKSKEQNLLEQEEANRK